MNSPLQEVAPANRHVLSEPISGRWRMLMVVLGVFLPLFAFGWLVENIRNRGGADWDPSAVTFVHKHDSPALDGVLNLVAQSGDIRMVMVLTVLCAITLLILQQKQAERFLARSVVGAAVIIVLLKASFHGDQSHLWRSLAPQPDIASPSAHSMAACTVVLVLALIAWKTRWRWATIILGSCYAASVALSQVYLGIHQASDVLSASALALAWVISMNLLCGMTWAEVDRKKLRLVLVFLGGILAGLVGYISSDLAHDNLRTLASGQAYRSGQMSTNALARCIRTYRVKSILNLRGQNPSHPWYGGETNTAEALHVAHYDFGISSSQELRIEDMDKIAQLLGEAPKPVLIHCIGGADRSGLAAAIYLYTFAGKTPEEAGRELSLWNGHVPLLRPWVSAMDHSFWRYVSNRVSQAKPGTTPGY